MHDAKKEIVNALKSIYGEKLLAIYDKSAETMSRQSNLEIKNEYLFKKNYFKD